MTESAPIPGTGPEATSEQLRESHEQFLASFADTLRGAEQLAESRGELPDEINAIFQDLASRVQARRVVIEEGKSYGGGVETPDVVETHYFITLHNQDDTDVTLPMNADDARALLAFARKHKPAEVPAAEPAEQTDDAEEEYDDEEMEEGEYGTRDNLEYIRDRFTPWNPPTLEDLQGATEILEDDVSQDEDGTFRDENGDEIPAKLVDDVELLANRDVWRMSKIELRLTKQALEFDEVRQMSEPFREDFADFVEYQMAEMRNPEPTFEAYRQCLQDRIDLHEKIVAKYGELREKKPEPEAKQKRGIFRRLKRPDRLNHGVQPGTEPAAIDEPGEVSVPETPDDEQYDQDLIFGDAEEDDAHADTAEPEARQKARTRIGRFLGDVVANARIEFETQRLEAEKARAAQAAPEAPAHSPARPAGHYRPTHR